MYIYTHLPVINLISHMCYLLCFPPHLFLVTFVVCQKLVEKGIQVRIFSKHEGFKHDLVSYTYDINEMHEYKYTLIGKLQKSSVYKSVLKMKEGCADLPQQRYLLDYTVPFLPLKVQKGRVHHVQIGVLKVTDQTFLKGYYDICFGIPQVIL
jgi:hypothetical protein